MIAAEVKTPTFFSDHNYSAFLDHTEMKEWCDKMIGAQAQFREFGDAFERVVCLDTGADKDDVLIEYEGTVYYCHVSDEYPWTYSFMGDKTVWHFAREESATMFRLRWL